MIKWERGERTHSEWFGVKPPFQEVHRVQSVHSGSDRNQTSVYKSCLAERYLLKWPDICCLISDTLFYENCGKVLVL